MMTLNQFSFSFISHNLCEWRQQQQHIDYNIKKKLWKVQKRKTMQYNEENKYTLHTTTI